MEKIIIPCKSGEVSDGFHTFNELYDHRCTLFAALMSLMPDRSWFAAKHHDGTEWEGWLLCGIDLPEGDTVTYHLPDKLIPLLSKTGAKYMEFGKKWDGHTPADVIIRLQGWILSANSEVSHGANNK